MIYFNILNVYSCFTFYRRMTKLLTFSGAFVLLIRVSRFTGCISLCLCCTASTPTCSGGLPVCQVPGRCSTLSEAGLVTAQGGTVDLPGMGRRALVGWFIIAHTATAILNVFDQYAGSTYNSIC